MPGLKHPRIQGSLVTVALVGAIVFLYQLAQVIGKIQSWDVLWNPPTVSQLLLAVVAGLGAIAAALGVDLPLVVQTLGRTKPPGKDGEP